jgi:hypothetical protein
MEVRLKNYRRLSQASIELYDALMKIEAQHELTIFELLYILAEQASSFAKSGRELEEDEAYEKKGG